MVRSIATKGRVAAMLVVGLLGGVVGVLIDRSGTFSEEERVEFIAGYALTIFVPLACVVIGSAALGNLRENANLVYLWLRPIGRWQITLAAWVASLIVLVPVVLAPMLVFGLILGSDSGDVIGLLVASLLGVVAYSALFNLLGLATKRALLWGLVYIAVWEGLIAGWSRAAGLLAIRTYTSSAMAHISGFLSWLEPTSGRLIAIVVTCVTAVALGFTTLRLSRMDVD